MQYQYYAFPRLKKKSKMIGVVTCQSNTPKLRMCIFIREEKILLKEVRMPIEPVGVPVFSVI